MNDWLFNRLVWGWIILAIVIFPILFKVTPPYGRHLKQGWGPMIPNRLGWIVMESISFLLMGWFFITNVKSFSPVFIFFSLWLLHYLNRSFIFSARIKTRGKKMPLVIMLLAIVFNFVNAYINGYYLSHHQELYPASWFSDGRFIVGFILFATGMYINISSDNHLIDLRKNHEEYKIPYGGIFRYVSCPNHFGEMLEWTGFAIMTWSLPGLAFALWTIINLLPRSLAHHRWYKQHFHDYPGNRKAVIPYLL